MLTQDTADLPSNLSALALHSHPDKGRHQPRGVSAINEEEAQSQEVPKNWRQRRPRWLKAAWLIAVYVWGLALMRSFCRSAVIPTSEYGTLSRRLAEGDGQEENDLRPPSTPELLELCLGLEQDFAPEEPSPEMVASSPLVKQSFLDLLLQDDEAYIEDPEGFLQRIYEGQGDSVTSFSMKRPAPDGSEDDEETLGPSWKAARKEYPSVDAQSAVFPSTSHQSSEASGTQHSAPASVGPCDSHPPSSSSFDLAALLAFPTTAQEPFGGGSAHPYVRIPPLQPGVTPRPLQVARPERALRAAFPSLMREMRSLLLKPSLSQKDADLLVKYSETLIHYLRQRMTGPVSPFGVSLAIHCLGRRFMAFNHLYMASQALRQSWPSEPWWKEIAALVSHDFPYTPGQEATMNQERRSLAKKLISAITLYKSGIAPSAKTVIDIKRSLFGKSVAPLRFREPKWQAWRSDDDSYSGKT
ncbi:hypothetical protein Emag_000810 [Eimeria magna]